MTCAGLLAAGCGTFEVNSRLVTSTPVVTMTATNPPTSTPTIAASTETPTNRPTLDVNSIPSVIPRLPDAQIIVDINTQLIYRSTATLDEAVAFYARQMADAGWEQVTKQQDDENVSFAFKQDDVTVNIVIKRDWLGLLIEVSPAAKE